MPEVSINLAPVLTRDGVKAAAALAEEIWNEYFPPIIGQPQVEYMVRHFQSVPAIAAQLEREGYLYYLVEAAGERAGYVALVPRQAEGRLQISKLYLRKPWRGRGLGPVILARIAAISKELGYPRLYLTVNKYNTLAIAAYEKSGFIRTGELVTDIGGGYVMDDYEMQKTLSESC